MAAAGRRPPWAGAVGGGVLALIILAAAAAPLILPGDPLDMVGPPLQPPLRNWAFPLGTDQLGRSVAAGLAYGARLSVTIGAVAAFFSLVVGIGIGTLAGFLGGLVDDFLMRIAEAVQTVPVFLLALAIVSVLGPTPQSVVIAIAVASWPAPARLVRAEVLSLKTRDFVAGCRAIGMSPLRVAFQQILPNALAPVIALPDSRGQRHPGNPPFPSSAWDPTRFLGQHGRQRPGRCGPTPISWPCPAWPSRRPCWR
jgi:peptide/nickel transport system permease protein